MKLYKGTICSIILAGTLDEPPMVYKLEDNTYAAEFFLTIYKSRSNLDDITEDQFFLYRIIAKNSEAMKIKQLTQCGIQLFVEGELQDYHIAKSSKNNLVVAEITANKLWFVNSPEFNQLNRERKETQANLFPKNIFDVCKSAYMH